MCLLVFKIYLYHNIIVQYEIIKSDLVTNFYIIFTIDSEIQWT